VSMTNILSVDVEDWFHILDAPSAPRIEEWDSLPSRVEMNFQRLLDLFGRHRVHATCFFLGWVAGRFPHLVQEAVAHGHEIASHGYSHRLAYEMSPAEFLQDIQRARNLLQDISGQSVIGYRAPGFSATKATPWFFEKIAEAGYRYDSSVFPGLSGHGGIANSPCAPYVIQNTTAGGLFEFPISVVETPLKRLCFFGGGYLRLFPWRLTKSMADRVGKQGRPVIFYIHPREIDPGHPRLPMGPIRTFKSYVNLGSTYSKLQRVVAEFEVTTFQSFLEIHRPEFAAAVPKKRAAFAGANGVTGRMKDNVWTA
jgi:polysaccharide deacetylase family protein (PEP-CTERM system associated)